MAKKTLGHIELEWTCPSCGTRNPGRAQNCRSCGTPMPADLRFEVGVGQPLDTSEETAARVAQGPDIHCPYCGARNAGAATTCRQCGGDLSEGARRAAGGVLGAYQSGPPPDVTCPHCGATNPGAATTCAQCGGALPRPMAAAPAGETEPAPTAAKRRSIALPIALLAGLLACVGIVLVIRSLGRSTAMVGTVAEVEWTYTIVMEQLAPVEYEAWRDEVPRDARLGECASKVRRTVDEPVPGATEVCGRLMWRTRARGRGAWYKNAAMTCRRVVSLHRAGMGQCREETATGADLEPYWPAAGHRRRAPQGPHRDLSRCVRCGRQPAGVPTGEPGRIPALHPGEPLGDRGEPPGRGALRRARAVGPRPSGQLAAGGAAACAQPLPSSVQSRYPGAEP